MEKKAKRKRSAEELYKRTTTNRRKSLLPRNEEQTINAAIKTLSAKQELVYRLIREDGHSRNEVSKSLKISPNTVKATMQNALHHLKKRLL